MELGVVPMPDDSALPDAGVQQPPPGWYPDPEMPGQQRYWDGDAWALSLTPVERRARWTFAGLSAAGVIAVVIENALFNFSSSVPSLASCNGDSACRANICHELNELASTATGLAFIP